MPATSKDGLADLERGADRAYAETVNADPDVLTLGPVTLSRGRREVRLHGEEIALTPMELALLRYLMERAGAVVSRDALLAEVWGFLARGETRTVEVHVGHLRKKLGDPSLIRTVRGIGYKADAR